MSKIIIKDDEIWAHTGEKAKPNAARFQKGNETGFTASPPKHTDHNFQQNRADVNAQAILREGVTPWHVDETYPLDAVTKVDGVLYISKLANNKGNDPKSLGAHWKLNNLFTIADKNKLDGIEANATKDQTATEIKTAYESNSNTNAFTDDDKTRATSNTNAIASIAGTLTEQANAINDNKTAIIDMAAAGVSASTPGLDGATVQEQLIELYALLSAEPVPPASEVKENLGLSSLYSDSSIRLSGIAAAGITITFSSDGTFDVSRVEGSDQGGQYLTDTNTSIDNDYEIRYIKTGGDDLTSAPIAGVWHSLVSDQIFEMTVSTGGGGLAKSGVFLFEIRDQTTQVGSSQTLTMQITAESMP